MTNKELRNSALAKQRKYIAQVAAKCNLDCTNAPNTEMVLELIQDLDKDAFIILSKFLKAHNEWLNYTLAQKEKDETEVGDPIYASLMLKRTQSEEKLKTYLG